MSMLFCLLTLLWSRLRLMLRHGGFQLPTSCLPASALPRALGGGVIWAETDGGDQAVVVPVPHSRPRATPTSPTPAAAARRGTHMLRQHHTLPHPQIWVCVGTVVGGDSLISGWWMGGVWAYRAWRAPCLQRHNDIRRAWRMTCINPRRPTPYETAGDV